MSKVTRDKKRRARQGASPPTNDWVYACPAGLATAEIAATLGATGQPITEVSGRDWQHNWQMANAFMDAYDYPREWRWLPGESVGWGGFKDWMLPKQARSHMTERGRIERIDFLGELVIVRQSAEAAELALVLLLDVMRAHVDWSRQQYHAHARILLVLEGWPRPVVAGRLGERLTWNVNPWPAVPPT